MTLFNVEDNKLRPPMRGTQRTVLWRGGYAILRRGVPDFRLFICTMSRASGGAMNHLFFLLTLAAYLGSFAAYVGYLVAGLDWSGRLGSLLFAGCLVAHYFAFLDCPRGLNTLPYHALSGSISLFLFLL